MTSPYNPADKLGKKLSQIEARLTDVEKAQSRSQLGKSSLDAGRILVKDRRGVVRQRIGDQGDGTYGVVDRNGPTPPVPTAPNVSPLGAALSVEWDGKFFNDTARPADFRMIEVHASTNEHYTPNYTTKRNFILDTNGDGGLAVIEATERLYIRLVAVSTSGVKSPASEPVVGEPGPVVADDVLDGSITETKIADDSISTPKLQASAVEAGNIAANAITSAKIQAGSITAAKLAAELVLSSKFIAGVPGGERVEISQSGLVQYGKTGAELTRIGPSPDASGNKLRVATGDSGAYVELGTGARMRAENPDGGQVDLDADNYYPVLRFWNRNRNRYGFINLVDSAYDDSGDNAWLAMTGASYPLNYVPGTPSGYSRLILEEGGLGRLETVRASDQSYFGGRILWNDTGLWMSRLTDGRVDRRISLDGQAIYLESFSSDGSRVAHISQSANGNTIYSGTRQTFYVNGGVMDFAARTASGQMYNYWLGYSQPDQHNNSPFLEGVNRGIGVVFGNRHLYIADANGNHRPLTCSTLTQSSGRDQKTDLQPVPFDPIETINAAPVEMWRYKNDPDGVQHIGPMADDLPEPIQQTSSDNGNLMIDTTSMMGIMWAAMQKMSEKLDDISERLDKLENPENG